MTAPLSDDKPELTQRQLLSVLLPGFALAVGAGLWLWSRTGLLVWFDSAAAMLAGCLG
jgi:hypothetical protein